MKAIKHFLPVLFVIVFIVSGCTTGETTEASVQKDDTIQGDTDEENNSLEEKIEISIYEKAREKFVPEDRTVFDNLDYDLIYEKYIKYGELYNHNNKIFSDYIETYGKNFGYNETSKINDMTEDELRNFKYERLNIELNDATEELYKEIEAISNDMKLDKSAKDLIIAGNNIISALVETDEYFLNKTNENNFEEIEKNHTDFLDLLDEYKFNEKLFLSYLFQAEEFIRDTEIRNMEASGNIAGTNMLEIIGQAQGINNMFLIKDINKENIDQLNFDKFNEHIEILKNQLDAFDMLVKEKNDLNMDEEKINSFLEIGKKYIESAVNLSESNTEDNTNNGKIYPEDLSELFKDMIVAYNECL